MAEQLCEFRAGKLNLSDQKMVADTRKGALQILRNFDGEMHVRWLDRNTRETIDDFTVTPEEARIVPMNNPRCFYLSFSNSSERNFYFWMQEPKPEADSGLIETFNQFLSSPTPAEPTTSQAPQPAQALGTPASPLVGGPIDASMLAAAMGGMVGGSADAGAGGAEAGGLPFDASMLAAALGNALQGGSAGGGGGYSSQMVAPGPSLAEVLSPSELQRVLCDPSVTPRLADHCPPQHQEHHHLMQLAHSPHFLQQIEAFSRALQTGQLDLTQFGLPLGTGYSVAEFLEAIQRQVEE